MLGREHIHNRDYSIGIDTEVSEEFKGGIENQSFRDSQIHFTDDLSQFKDKLQCGICFQTVTKRKRPVECEKCHNQIYCSGCFSNWLKQNRTCPYCKQRSEGVPPGPFIMNLIKSMKFQCKFKDQGCNQLLPDKLRNKHEFSCKYGEKTRKEQQKCKICNEKLQNNGQTHLCKNDEEAQLCPNHLKCHQKFDNERIENLSQIQNSGIKFNCMLCERILCQPFYCQKCSQSFCKVCIAMKLQVNNQCPSCNEWDPEIKEIKRNDLSFFTLVRVKCRNFDKGCQMITSYVDLKEHEDKCFACDQCKYKCNKCSQTLNANQVSTHQCKQEDIEHQNALIRHEDEQPRAFQPLLGRDFNNEQGISGHYGKRVVYCVQNYLSVFRHRIKYDIPFIIFDFLFQNALFGTFIYYCTNEYFVTGGAVGMFYFIMFLYYSVIVLVSTWIIIQRKYSQNDREAKWRVVLGKTLLWLFSLFFGRHLYIAFFPLFVKKLDKTLTNELQRETRSIRQFWILSQLILIPLQIANQFDSLTKLIVLALSDLSLFVNYFFMVEFGKKQ